MKTFKQFLTESYDFSEGQTAGRFTHYTFDNEDGAWEIIFEKIDVGEEVWAEITMQNRSLGKTSYERSEVGNPRKVLNTRIEIIKNYMSENPEVAQITSDPTDEHRRKLWSFTFKRAGLKVNNDGMLYGRRPELGDLRDDDMEVFEEF